MLAEIIFARTLRRQRLEERSLLFSLIKCFTPGHTKTPLPPSVADPNPPPQPSPPKKIIIRGYTIFDLQIIYHYLLILLFRFVLFFLTTNSVFFGLVRT